ncbi:MAG: glycine zipper 2TM domain-containing protein [Legionella sp.]|nr:glycine zipper 2TM domain-containing protein [Legionella sp.]
MKKCIATLSLSALLFGCAPMNNADVGTISGGVVGGLLGSQFGGGSGKVLAAGAGAIAGAFIGGRIGQTMDRQDQLEMRHALETAPSGREVAWVNPESGNHYCVRPTRTYYIDEQPCREYSTRALIGGKSQQIYGKACRQRDGSWRVVN